MINLIANSIDLTRAAVEELLAHLSVTTAAPHESHDGAASGLRSVRDDRCGVPDEPAGPASPIPV